MKSKAVLYLVVPLLAIVVFVIDQITKYWVSTGLAIGEAWMPVEVIARFVVVRHVRNSGAAFGIFPAAGPIFLGIAIVVVIGIVLYYYSRMNTAPLWVRISLGLMLGGAFGNMIDRMRFGYVVDFVDVGWFPVFNVADSSIVIGVTMLALYMSFFQPRSEQPAKPSLDQTPTS